MKLAYLLAAVAASSLCLTACDAPKEEAKPAAPAAAAPPPSPPPPPAAAAAPAAQDPTMAGLAYAYASEAEWVTACTTKPNPKIPQAVCECVGKATVKEVGAEGLYDWAFEYFVNRNGMERSRAERWFTSKNIDKPKQQKLADTIGKCYTN